MQGNNDKRCLFMGLPNSGKSTFIGALWHVLVSKEIDSLYTIDVEPENRAYLNSLRDAWSEFRSPMRTADIGLSNIITIKVEEKASHRKFDLAFPDASGEYYESQFAFRKLSSEYLELVESMNGMVIFVNPDFVISSNLITDAGQVFYDKFFEDKAKFLGLVEKVTEITTASTSGQEGAKGVKNKPAYIEWKEKYSQSQVILIDLLQMIMYRVPKPCRIAIVISAWDTITSLPGNFGKQKPGEWFSKKLPLLKQFLTSNGEIFTYSIFGVSAQGGKYDNRPDNGLYLIDIPAERIKVQLDNKTEHDITIPIKWVLND
jgi:GTPase SAR1 family protein